MKIGNSHGRSLFVALLLAATAWSAISPPGGGPNENDPDANDLLFKDLAARAARLGLEAKTPTAGVANVAPVASDVTDIGQTIRALVLRDMVERQPSRSPYRPVPSSIQLAPSVPLGSYRPPRTGDFVFHLLPKSFQLHPLLDMTVVTRFTAYGRQFPPATPEHPTYYALQSAGYREMGEGVGGMKPPPPARLEAALRNALASNGYLLFSGEQPPGLAVFLTWGVHMAPPAGELLPNYRAISQGRRERTILVSGTGGLSSRDPDKRDVLFEQAQNDLYFAIASAYDYDQLALGNRKLVWRTNMTVGADGVLMKESLTPLIASAAPFFGREMTEPELTSRHINRLGRVEIGPTTVVEDSAPRPAPVPEARKSGKP